MAIFATSNNNTNYAISGQLSTKFDAVGPDPTHAVGTREFGVNGTQFIYTGPATVAIGQYNAVHISSTFVPNSLTDTLAKTSGFIGATQVAFTTSDYGWVALSGKVTINAAVNTNKDVPLYSSNTAGLVDDLTASGSAPELMGIRLVASNGTTTAGSAMLYNVVVRFPN